MRDLLLATFLFAALPVAVARPYIGALIFAWLGLMNPHRMAWGFAATVPWAHVYALATLIGLIFTADREPLDSLKRFRTAIVYLAWMCVTTLFAFYPISALARLTEVTKIYLMCIVTLMVLTSTRRIEWLVLIATLSIAFYGIKGGVFTIGHGGAYRVFGPERSVIADNNQLAVALVMTIPLMYWMMRRAVSRWQRYVVGICMLLVAASVFGSHSRGALLALAAMGTFLFAKSGNKTLIAVLVLMSAIAATELMPESYWTRMSSITAPTGDRDWSAESRILTWIMATNIANSNFTGGGFDYYSPEVVASYSSEPMLAYSAHSIYFQALGEHGWLGLALFLLFWIGVWRACRRVTHVLPSTPEGENLRLLIRMIQTSLVGFAMGGAFVNIGYWDFPFYLAAVVFGIERLASAPAPARERHAPLADPAIPHAGS